MSSIDKAALMKLMEVKYDPENFKKIVGGAYRIECYGDEDRQQNTDVREGVKGGGKGGQGRDNYNDPISVETADPEHGDI